MKKYNSIIFMLLFFPFFTNILWGQEKKNSIIVSGSIAHYTTFWDSKSRGSKGYRFPLSSGAEIIYSRQIFENMETMSGINFQKIHAWSNVDLPDILVDYSRKFWYDEISVPLLFKNKFPLKDQNQWYITIGFYNGLQKNVISKTYQRVGWTTWEDIKTIAGYSSDHFFTDIYFDTGYFKSLNNWGGIAIAPFLKYRANSTWLNTYQNRIHWGIKFNYSFKF